MSICVQFPGLKDHIYGEESNTFANKLGESVTVEIKQTEAETCSLLGNHQIKFLEITIKCLASLNFIFSVLCNITVHIQMTHYLRDKRWGPLWFGVYS